MNLIRLVILVAVIWIVVWMVRRWLEQKAPRMSREHRHTLEGADMVKCAVCGLHVPREGAEQEGGRYFCSREHKKQALEESEQ